MDSNPSQVKTKDYKIVVIILAWNGVDYGFKPQSGKNQGLQNCSNHSSLEWGRLWIWIQTPVR